MKKKILYKKLEIVILFVVLTTIFTTGIWLILYYKDADISLEYMKQISVINKENQVIESNFEYIDTISAFESQEQLNESYTKEQEMLRQFTELYNINSDIIGWISIEETNVNYPVMYTPDDNEYYIHRNIEKEYEGRGLPFLDGNTDLENSQNYIIYGHNMSDGTIFHDLLYYKDESYYRDHTHIKFSTLYEEAKYEIVSIFESEIFYQNQDVFKYYKYINVMDGIQFKDYVDNIKELSLYDTGVSIAFGDRLITLSTCSYHVKDGRFVVVAKKL